MINEERSMLGLRPWMPAPFGAFPNFAVAGCEAANAMAGFQRIWFESMSAALRGLQVMTVRQTHRPQSTMPGGGGDPGKVTGGGRDRLPAIAASQDAFKNAQDLGTMALSANMKAFDTVYGRFAAMWGEMSGLTHEKAAAGRTLSQGSAAAAYEDAARETWQTFEKAQETSAKAWNMLQKRLTEGVKELNSAAGTRTDEGADIPDAIKESYERFAADSSRLFEVMQKSNANALSLMQKRVSSAVEEITSHCPQIPGKNVEKLESATHAYERAASTISDALVRANREAMEAVQAWSMESMKAGTKAGQRAA
jgi:hypothetical protein